MDDKRGKSCHHLIQHKNAAMWCLSFIITRGGQSVDRRGIMVATGSDNKSYRPGLAWLCGGTALLFLAACQPTGMTNRQPPASTSTPVSSAATVNTARLSTDVVIKPLGANPAASVMKKDSAPAPQDRIASIAPPAEVPPALASPENTVATAVMDSIIWQLQTVAPVKRPGNTPRMPDQTEADDVLGARFALLTDAPPVPPAWAPVTIGPKVDGTIRVGILVPLTGRFAHLGAEIRRGIEMALFQIGNPALELVFFDTKAGPNAAAAAAAGLTNEVDIFIGPLFSSAVQQVRNALAGSAIPLLALSNNVEVARAEQWVLGYLPEQQLDGLLGHAITTGKRRFAIIAQDTAFGRRLQAHAARRLADFGLQADATLTLANPDLDQEDRLKAAIKQFSRFVEPEENQTLPPSPFDVVIFAGGPEFALRTAPVLAYYDLGPDRALYLGNDLWDQPQILTEPSLQGGLFPSRPTARDPEFVKNWQTVWQDQPSALSRLGFDAMALVAALAGSERTGWSKQLVSQQGFHGYSGAFRLLPDGRNIRAFELRKIDDGRSKIVKPAANRI